MQLILAPALAAAVAGALWTTARRPEDTTSRLVVGIFLVSGVTTAVGLAAALFTRHPLELVLAVAAGGGAHLAARRWWPARSRQALTFQALGLMLVAFVLTALGG